MTIKRSPDDFRVEEILSGLYTQSIRHEPRAFHPLAAEDNATIGPAFGVICCLLRRFSRGLEGTRSARP
jgi:hypothetical protein